MEAIAIVTALLVAQAFLFAARVGAARVKYGIEAPATTGDPQFERAFRVHQNTIEQLIIVLPSMWMFSYFVSVWVAAGLGVLFIVSRFIYQAGYLADPKKRDRGFVFGAIIEAVLVLGSLIGAGVSWFRA